MATRSSSVVRWIVGVVALLLPAILARAGGNSYDYRWLYYRPGELRILLDTSVVETPLLSHSSTTRDVRGWLVCIDLKSPADLADRTRAYGPLWAAPGTQSWLSHVDGITFTKEDRDAQADAGFVAFDPAGEVVRIRDAGARSRLNLSPQGAAWVADGKFVWTASRLPPGSEDTLQTLDHRYTLHRDEENGARLFETLSGERVADPWLEKAFSTYRSMKEMGNVHAMLTNERDYLLCYVAPFWNRRWEPKAPRADVDTFEWEGRTYDRATHAFYFKRGSDEPHIFPKPKIEGVTLFDRGPVQALSIDGQLHLLYLAGHRIVLQALETGTARVLDLPADPSTDLGPDMGGIMPSGIQHLPELDSLALFATHYSPTHVTLHLWNYKTGAHTAQSFDTTVVFEGRLMGGNSPRHLLKVREIGAK